MSNKKGEKTYSSRVVFELPPSSGQLPMVTEVAEHKAGLVAVLGGRVELKDAPVRLPLARYREPSSATFREAGRREVKEETGNKGSSDPNDGIDVLVGEQIWEYHHDTNPNHVTKVFAGVAIGGLMRPVAHRLGVMESSVYSLEEIDDLHEHGMLRGWQDWQSVHEYWDRRDDLLVPAVSTIAELTAYTELTGPARLGELALV